MAAENLPSSAELSEQLDALQFAALSADDSVRLGVIAAQRALAQGLAVLIEIRLGDRVVFRAALEGTTPSNDDWLRRKFAVVHRFSQSSLAVRVRYEEQGTDFHTATGLPESDYAVYGGGFPLMVRGVGMVGVMGVSGLPHLEDHRLIVESITDFLADR